MRKPLSLVVRPAGARLKAGTNAATEPKLRSIDPDALVSEISRDRTVHVTLATSVYPPERLLAPLRGGARRIVLSDHPASAEDCNRRAEMLRGIDPRIPIETAVVERGDYWHARKVAQCDVVLDIGQLIHDDVADRRFTRLADMSKHLVCIWSMVIPPQTVLPGNLQPRFRIHSAAEVDANEPLREALREGYGKRGINLRQLGPEGRGVVEWQWFFMPEALVELGRSVGLRVQQYAYHLGGLAMTIVFEKVER